ncbi:hypothetical protein EMMF5_002542 [Cystobasidiomycetes sp. EMM_F5]
MHTLLDSTATNAHRKVRSPAHVQAFSRLSGRQQSTSPQRKIRPIKDHRHPYNTTQLVILVKDLQQETAELCSNLARLQVAEHAYGKDPARLTKALDKAYDAVRDAQKVCHTCLDRAGLQIIEEKENVKVTPVHTRFVEADVVVKAHPQSPSPVVVKAAIPHTPPPARDVQARKISRIKSPIRVRVETPSKTEVFVISRPPARVLSTPPRGSPSAPQLQPSPEITPPAKDAKKDWYHLSKNQALDAIAKQASKWGQRPAAVKLPLSHGCLMMGANQAGAYPTLTIKGFKTLTLHKVLAVAKYGPNLIEFSSTWKAATTFTSTSISVTAVDASLPAKGKHFMLEWDARSWTRRRQLALQGTVTWLRSPNICEAKAENIKV